MKFLSKSLFGEPTWFYVVHPNLDPNLGVVMGVEEVYPSMWELKVQDPDKPQKVLKFHFTQYGCMGLETRYYLKIEVFKITTKIN